VSNPTLPSFRPISAGDVVARALAQRGMGSYQLGGGAIFTAPNVFAPDGNNYPNTCDCSGLLAYALAYRKGQWNVNGIYTDAKIAKTRFRFVGDDETVRPSDLILFPGPDHDGDGLPDPGTHGHCGVITQVLPGFVRHAPGWEKQLRVTHCSGYEQYHLDPATGKPYGAVREMDASIWARVSTSRIVRPEHVTGGGASIGKKSLLSALLLCTAILVGFSAFG
jgi:hypothetical protein